MSISPLTEEDIAKLLIPPQGRQYTYAPIKEEVEELEPEPRYTPAENPAPPPKQSIDELDPELAAAISSKAKYVPLDFEDAIELLFFIDAGFRSGRRNLHAWQVEELQRLCRNEYTFQEPLKYCLTAANGSGKDAFVIALFCLWKVTCRVRSRTIVTSASHKQLKNQTENYIREYSNKLNQTLQELQIHDKALVVKKQHIGCNLTGSEIVLFVTDEPGNAEGYHPFPDYSHNIDIKEPTIIDGEMIYPGGDLTIIQNEAKSIPNDIDEAIGRCTYNRLLKISSPGHTAGHFYADYTKSVVYPAAYVVGKIYSRRVTSYDCPHISPAKIEQDRDYYGENSPIFRSKHLALFTSVGEQVVILRESLTSCLAFNAEPCNIGLGRRAGLDLAQGGDENTLYIFDENVLFGYEAFTMSDTFQASIIIVDMFNKYGLKESNIWADDGVAGHGHIDNIRASGWNINRVRNQSPAIVKQHYGNRGAELWFNFARLIQEKKLNLAKAPSKAIDQLSSRYYKQQETLGKLILESKKEARANGHSSPDHADAMVLAFTGVTIDTFRGKEVNGKAKKETVTSPMEAVMNERNKHFDELLKRGERKVSGITGNNLQSTMRSLYGK